MKIAIVHEGDSAGRSLRVTLRQNGARSDLASLAEGEGLDFELAEGMGLGVTISDRAPNPRFPHNPQSSDAGANDSGLTPSKNRSALNRVFGGVSDGQPNLERRVRAQKKPPKGTPAR